MWFINTGLLLLIRPQASPTPKGWDPFGMWEAAAVEMGGKIAIHAARPLQTTHTTEN